MAAENCPFHILKKEIQDEKKKDQFVSFDYIIDPDNADLKTTVKIKKLSSNDVEEILCFFKEFDDLVDELEIGEGPPRFRLIKRLLSGNIKQHWLNKKEEYEDDDEVVFAAVRQDFLRSKMDDEISLDTKEWLKNIHKPRSMTVAEFVDCLTEINDLIDVMPDINGDAIPKYSEPELSVILRNSVPRSWKKDQV